MFELVVIGMAVVSSVLGFVVLGSQIKSRAGIAPEDLTEDDAYYLMLVYCPCDGGYFYGPLAEGLYGLIEYRKHLKSFNSALANGRDYEVYQFHGQWAWERFQKHYKLIALVMKKEGW